MPVKVSGGATYYQVKVYDQGIANKSGVTGVVLSVQPEHKPRDDEEKDTTVELDYSAFRDAVGGDYGNRLSLSTLPDCALTTPEKSECQTRQRIHTANNARSSTLTATVPRDRRVLAIAAEGKGENGTFEASDLKPSGEWSVTGATGAFTWSYPVEVPPVAAGKLAPSISLGYNSSAVDGLTSSTNNQAPWTGAGFGYTPGSIERTYRACADDTSLPKEQQTGDYCWAGQIVSLNLGDASAELVWDAGKKTWKAANDTGARIEQREGAANGAYKGEYWVVTKADGTAYYFGLNKLPGNTGQEETKSAFTTRVYGPKQTDQCYQPSGFANAKCDNLGWRFNLDYVEDTNGNAAAYYYNQEKNFYGANRQTTGVEYVRGGQLKRIDYGLRKINGSVYGPTVPNQVTFETTERCVPGSVPCEEGQRNSTTAAQWPDVPTDQECKAGAVCNNNAPSFWTTKKLSTIVTYYNTGAGPVKVDRYGLGHSYPIGGDRSLQLDTISHTSYGKDGAEISAPPVSFGRQLKDNRVLDHDSRPAMAHWRITNINTDAGMQVRIGYSDPSCTKDTLPKDLAHNKTLCYPVYEVPPGKDKPEIDYFHKYVVNEVAVHDRSIPDAQPRITSYKYMGDPGWHRDDMELVKPEHRTYGQFRGYQQVEVRQGNTTPRSDDVADRRTLVRTTYFRGMDGDVLPDGSKRSAPVPDSQGGSVPDNPLFADREREVQTFEGEGGNWISTTITDYAHFATLAKRDRKDLPPLEATIVNTSQSREITRLAGGGTRTLATASRYDDVGRLTATSETGDDVEPKCVTKRYADNTTSWIRDRVKEEITSKQVCPPKDVEPTSISKATRNYYDSSAELGIVPGAGNLTRTDSATANNADVLTWVTSATTTYDDSGRNLSVTDVLNRTTRYAYTPVNGGVLSKIVTTNPKGQKKTVEKEPAHGKDVVLIDEGGRRTDAEYDPAGRMTKVWKPGQSKGKTSPTDEHSYLMRTDGPLAVTTKSLNDTGKSTNTITTVSLFDGLGQLIQTQEETRNNQRIVTDIGYDSLGRKRKSNNRYLVDGPPGTTLIRVADSAVASRTRIDYDGSGRQTAEVALTHTTETARTTTIYSGDSTTEVAPEGGVTTTKVFDARKRVVELRQHTTTPSPNATAKTLATSAFETTKYTFTADGREKTIVAPTGKEWSYEYDFVGNPIKEADPDAGRTTSTFDLAGQLIRTEDSRGNVITFEYDELGRKTAEYKGEGNARTKLAAWTYDGATNGVGKPYTTTRFTPEGAYRTAIRTYDPRGNKNEEWLEVPSSVTGLGGLYKTMYSYTTTGQLTAITPHTAGGLPGESVSLTYDRFGKAETMTGYNTYVHKAEYTGFHEVRKLSLGPETNTAALSYDYDDQTRLVTGVNLSAVRADSPQLDDLRYSYDPAGNRVRTVNTQGHGPKAPVRTECYDYDKLNRLTDAWTATDNCAAAPSQEVVGGPNPYWTSWSFTPGGQRAAEVQHAKTGDTVTTYEYNQAKTSRTNAHSVKSASTKRSAVAGAPGLAAKTVDESYGYDDFGNTVSRPGPTGRQTLNWDEQNRLASVQAGAATTQFVYDADGNQLLRKDPDSSTLYLPTQELRYDSATQKLIGTRYYKFNDVQVAMRIGNADPTYSVSDPHSTATVAVSSGQFAVTRREFDPYGKQIGTGQGEWPDDHGFLNAPVNPGIGLVDVGARKYDPQLGRFISVDPKMDTGNPQQLNAYTYANDNPVTFSDPSGEFFGLILGLIISRIKALSVRPDTTWMYDRGKKRLGVPGNYTYERARERGVGELFREFLMSDKKEDRPTVYYAKDGDKLSRDLMTSS
ncbi:MAG TPA: RHS repeat-associated core domain-containing protein, partial [Lentzea sp.]